jgi:hypothetical protein
VVESLVGPDAHRDAGRVDEVHVVRDPEARDQAILSRFTEIANGNAAAERRDQRIAVGLLRDAVHRHVDFLLLGVFEFDQPRGEALARGEVEVGIDREGRIRARSCRHIGVHAVSGGVDPEIVELRLERVYERRVVGVIDRLRDVIGVRRNRNELVVAVIGRAELDRVLAGEDHHLQVHDAAARFLHHRDAGLP